MANHFQVTGPKGTPIYHTGFGLLPPMRSGEAEANARLIAAAPDLLNELKRLFSVVFERFEGLEIVASVPGELRNAMQSSLDVIAKAEGGTK